MDRLNYQHSGELVGGSLPDFVSWAFLQDFETDELASPVYMACSAAAAGRNEAAAAKEAGLGTEKIAETDSVVA